MNKLSTIVLLILAGTVSVSQAYRDLDTGTFLTRDPIGYKDGPNVYCYVHCNPITKFDALGLAAERADGSYNGPCVVPHNKLSDLYILSGKSPGFCRMDGLTSADVIRDSIDVSKDGVLHIDAKLNMTVRLLDPKDPMATNPFYGEAYNPDKALVHEEEHVCDIVGDYNKMADRLNSLDGRKVKNGLSYSAVEREVNEYYKSERENLDKFKSRSV